MNSRERILVCSPESWSVSTKPYRFRLEDDLDESGFFTLSEEELESTKPDADVEQVVHALDLDLEQAIWAVEQLPNLLAGRPPRRRFLPGPTKRTRLRLEDDLVDRGHLVLADEQVTSADPMARVLATPGRISLDSEESAWFLEALAELLRPHLGSDPLQQGRDV
jgi:hypothetical protein